MSRVQIGFATFLMMLPTIALAGLVGLSEKDADDPSVSTPD